MKSSITCQCSTLIMKVTLTMIMFEVRPTTTSRRPGSRAHSHWHVPLLLTSHLSLSPPRSFPIVFRSATSSKCPTRLIPFYLPLLNFQRSPAIPTFICPESNLSNLSNLRPLTPRPGGPPSQDSVKTFKLQSLHMTGRTCTWPTLTTPSTSVKLTL